MILTRESLLRHVRIAKSGCWLWRRGRMGEGYGILKLNGVVRYAHRVAFELFHGRIPKGGLVCHHCDTPACVRPEHLYAGNNSTNMRDAWARGRRVA
jgi:Autographiviridae endonuclease